MAAVYTLRKPMSTKGKIDQLSCTFRWKIKNFSVMDLWTTDCVSIKSPSFKCGGANLHLEMFSVLGNIQLRVAQRGSGGSSGCASYHIKFHAKETPPVRVWTSTTPTKFSNIEHTFSIGEFKGFLMARGSVTVSFQALFDHNMNAELETETTVYETHVDMKQGSITLSENFQDLFESSRFSDVTLKVGRETFEAHKTVLACRSEVFGAMFESGMKEGVENEVNIVEMKPETAQEMLQYIYSGKIKEWSMDRAMDLYVAADRYDLQELKGWCKAFICKHISAADVCKVAVLSDLHEDKELADATKRVFKENSKSIIAMEIWRDFRERNPNVYSDLVESAV